MLCDKNPENLTSLSGSTICCQKMTTIFGDKQVTTHQYLGNIYDERYVWRLWNRIIKYDTKWTIQDWICLTAFLKIKKHESHKFYKETKQSKQGNMIEKLCLLMFSFDENITTNFLFRRWLRWWLIYPSI